MLTHCGPVVTKIWVNIGSGNGLLPDGTITWTNVDFSLVMSRGIHLLVFCIMGCKSYFQNYSHISQWQWGGNIHGVKFTTALLVIYSIGDISDFAKVTVRYQSNLTHILHGYFMALGQSYNYHSANEQNLMNMSIWIISIHQEWLYSHNKIKQSNIMCIF